MLNTEPQRPLIRIVAGLAGLDDFSRSCPHPQARRHLLHELVWRTGLLTVSDCFWPFYHRVRRAQAELAFCHTRSGASKTVVGEKSPYHPMPAVLAAAEPRSLRTPPQTEQMCALPQPLWLGYIESKLEKLAAEDAVTCPTSLVSGCCPIAGRW